MGSIITFGIDKFDLEWMKNGMYHNHSILFRKSDIQKEFYYYADNVKIKKNAFSRKLLDVKDSLDLLGFTLKNIRKEFNDYCRWYKEYNYEKPPVSYKDFYDIIYSIEPEKIDLTEDDDFSNNDYDFFEYFKYSIKNKLGLNNHYKYGDEEFYANIHPYIILRIMVENPINCNRKIIWRYSDVLEGGYIKQKELGIKIENKWKFLIVTEGSSDTYIIKKAFEILNPNALQYFSFVDMKENYPFSGTGNLLNFIRGLSRIDIINKILVIFDNDAEGSDKYEKCLSDVKLLPNIKVTKLPILKEFRKFKTIGPFGKKIQNINGKAVSIECFLDLKFKNQKEIIIRWKNYIEKLEIYQGALENKEYYASQFLKLKDANCDYDYSKLKYLLDYVIQQCIKLNEDNYFIYKDR